MPTVKSSIPTSIPDDAGDILTVDELVQYLKIPRSTIYYVLKKGAIPYRRIGRHLRFHRSVIERWIKHDPRFRNPVSRRAKR